MKYTNSIMEKISFNSHDIYLKRDDLLSKNFSGNKARKFYYYMNRDFPEIKKVISYGSAQSNAMYSLSCLCKIKNWDFEYYVDHIASYLKENPIGNYKAALNNGMKIYEKEFPLNYDKETLFINEGGANEKAQEGVRLLALEIKNFVKEKSLRNPKVFLPSGTGTSALFLQKNLDFEVITCSCVGKEDYLQKQFEALEKENFPHIIKKDKSYHFGKLYKEFYDMYKELLKQTKIEFDLLYDPLGFISMEKYLKKNKDVDMIYIHQGGILGNESMLERYKRKYEINE